MRLGFDVRPFLREETGVGVYFKNLLWELAKVDRENEYVLFSASWKDRFPAEKIPPFAKMRFLDKRWPVRAVDALWYGRRWPTLDRVAGAALDLTHSPTPLLLPTRGRTVVTVCDLYFLERPERADRQARAHFLSRTERALRDADAVVAISEFTKTALVRRFGLEPAKIAVTHLGVSPVFKTPPSPEEVEGVRRKHRLPGEFILFVGASEPRKNLPLLIDALALVHRKAGKIPLVIAGRQGGDAAAVEERVRALGLQDAVLRPGYVSDGDLLALYHAASAFVFPSSCEGFGLPLLEAMACGLPAAVSNAGALPEIGGEAAVYFDPEDSEAVAAALVRVLGDAGLRASLRPRGRERALAFDWARTAGETLALYRAVAGGR
ncbi:MAG: glycosyltransferase family 4 protein [Candidatus Aminicenantes bacterium]|nr:glycosyltransferase family 4 protein [Candidatus Aminicenantes bacterium]